MPKNLTDAEIKKALECCKYSIYEKRCADCLLIDEARCIEYVTKSALDLINRQEAENKELQDIIFKYNGNLAKQVAENQSLKAEIERLEAERDAMHRDVMTAEEYAWKLKREKESFADIGKLYSEIKAEAYKECIEKVKSLANNYSGYAFCQKLNNLLSEIIGE